MAGPSNIGCYLASLGIDATAGFGVSYRGLHGTDECIELGTIPTVQAAYHQAMRTLLAASASTGNVCPVHDLATPAVSS